MDEDPIIIFQLVDLEGVITSHEDTLVVRATIANYDWPERLRT